MFIVYLDKIIKNTIFVGKAKIGNSDFSSLAYADDLVVLAENEQDLQQNLSQLEIICLEYGLKINRNV